MWFSKWVKYFLPTKSAHKIPIFSEPNKTSKSLEFPVAHLKPFKYNSYFVELGMLFLHRLKINTVFMP